MAVRQTNPHSVDGRAADRRRELRLREEIDREQREQRRIYDKTPAVCLSCDGDRFDSGDRFTNADMNEWGYCPYCGGES